ncbi:hypothetical protein [Bradyrhizobium sp. LA7.1]|uniref:hypothetical protein n=1 Tax=Bradyrhizobium sp. LA7.1 TaxID=3156324 RepID=UPI003391412F
MKIVRIAAFALFCGLVTAAALYVTFVVFGPALDKRVYDLCIRAGHPKSQCGDQ